MHVHLLGASSVFRVLEAQETSCSEAVTRLQQLCDGDSGARRARPGSPHRLFISASVSRRCGIVRRRRGCGGGEVVDERAQLLDSLFQTDQASVGLRHPIDRCLEIAACFNQNQQLRALAGGGVGRLRQLEAVADSSNGLNEIGVLGVVFNPLSESLDRHVDKPAVAEDL